MDIVERLRDMQAKKYRSDWAHWVQTQCSEAASEIEQLRADIDDLRARLVQKMDDCVKADQRQKKDA